MGAGRGTEGTPTAAVVAALAAGQAVVNPPDAEPLVTGLELVEPLELDPPGADGGAPNMRGTPMRTLVAVTVFEDSVPVTATCSPTVTLEKDGEVTPGSTYFVEDPTSTVTVEPLAVVRVKVSSPTDLTVPTAVGGDPQPAMPPEGEVSVDPLGDVVPGDPEVDAAPATPPATASPRATAAAVVTRTPRLRRAALPAASAAVPEAGSSAATSPGRTGPVPSPACGARPDPEMLGWRGSCSVMIAPLLEGYFEHEHESRGCGPPESTRSPGHEFCDVGERRPFVREAQRPRARSATTSSTPNATLSPTTRRAAGSTSTKKG
jgi:hypothetical protein